MATREGARAIGLGDRIGSLEAGKQADLVILDSTHPTLCPIYNPVSQAVYAAGGDAVRDTIVAGRVRVRHHRMTDGDLDDVMDQVRAIGRRIQNARRQPPQLTDEKGDPT